MSQLAHDVTREDLYQGLYAGVLAPTLHERQMRAAYVGVYETAIRMGLAEVAARAHAARIEKRMDFRIRAGIEPAIVPTPMGGRVL